jgi:haloacetate dehalogenase
MFDGFTLEHRDVGDVTLRVRHGGGGPPIVLLHGHPRTHMTWHMVADELAATNTVVCPDLRGYGKSTQPPDGDHSKRAMAADVHRLMVQLGHERFAVAGHDRGSYVAMRLALDFPDAVTQVAVLDGVPVKEALDRTDARFAARWWHWWFFGQLDKPAERVINADPEAWYQISAEHMGAVAYADVLDAIHDPAVVHGMVEDYRAGLRIDYEIEEQDVAAGRRIRCPLLFGWSTRDDTKEIYRDPAAICHHMAEENPSALAAALRDLMKR